MWFSRLSAFALATRTGISLKQRQVARQSRPVHAEEVRKRLMNDRLRPLNGGKQQKLRDSQSTRAQGIVIELCEETGGAPAMETKAVPNIEKRWHPGQYDISHTRIKTRPVKTRDQRNETLRVEDQLDLHAI